MGSTSLENSPNRLLKLNAGTSDGLATLRSMCSPTEKWTRVHWNTRTSQTLPRAVDFPAPRPGLMMVPPGPPLLWISDQWVAFHTPLCPETSFQTCLPGTVLVFSFHPVIQGLTRYQAASGCVPEGTQCGAAGLSSSILGITAHTYTLAPSGGASRSLDQWSSAPSDVGLIHKKYL